jgi:hypothetical protein
MAKADVVSDWLASRGDAGRLTRLTNYGGDRRYLNQLSLSSELKIERTVR